MHSVDGVHENGSNVDVRCIDVYIHDTFFSMNVFF